MDYFEVKDSLDRARKILSRFPLWKLRDAKVERVVNPSDVYMSFDTWVLLEYSSWFGMRRTKVLFVELEAGSRNHQAQAVEAHTTNLIDRIKICL